MTTTTEQQKSILGTLILDETVLTHISDIVFPEMFIPTLQPIATMIWERHADGLGWDIAMCKDAGGSIVDDLIHAATNASLIEEQAGQVRDGWVTEQTVKLYAGFENERREGADYWDAWGKFTAEVEVLHGLVGVKEQKGDVIREALEEIMKAGREGVSGIPTPWASLTKFTCGWQPGTLTYIGARPGMGKTTLCLQIARHAAEAGFPTLFFSMGDLSAIQLVKKAIGMQTGIHAKKILGGHVNGSELKLISEAAEELYELPLFIRDITDVSNRIGAICDYTRRMKEKHNIALVIIDYVQQLGADANHRGNRNNEVGEISRKLKLTASLLNIPFIVPTQLSRSVESRGGLKIPEMSDLRDSGNLEQDADNIYFLYRPDYYGIEEDEEGRSLKYITELICRKDRVSGEDVPATFRLRYQAGRLVEDAPDAPQGEPINSNSIIASQRYDNTEVPF